MAIFKTNCRFIDKNKSTISRHIKNIFSEGELKRHSVVVNFATTASDNKTYRVDYYNLDVIISVGYRVKLLVAFFSASGLPMSSGSI